MAGSVLVSGAMFSSPTPDLWPAPLRPIAALGNITLNLVSALGRFGQFFAQGVGYVVIPPFKLGLLLDRIHFIGFRSLTIVILTGAFTGMVLGLQVFLVLSRFGSEAYLGPAVALSLITFYGFAIGLGVGLPAGILQGIL